MWKTCLHVNSVNSEVVLKLRWWNSGYSGNRKVNLYTTAHCYQTHCHSYKTLKLLELRKWKVCVCVSDLPSLHNLSWCIHGSLNILTPKQNDKCAPEILNLVFRLGYTIDLFFISLCCCKLLSFSFISFFYYLLHTTFFYCIMSLLFSNFYNLALHCSLTSTTSTHFLNHLCIYSISLGL